MKKALIIKQTDNEWETKEKLISAVKAVVDFNNYNRLPRIITVEILEIEE